MTTSVPTNEASPPPLEPRSFTWIGVSGSVVLLVAAALILAYAEPASDRMTVEEWSQFLAGAAAPIALLWLVLGYFQQGEELRQNTAALRLQHEELVHQVRETAALVRQSESQAETARLALEFEKTRHGEDRRKRQADAELVLVQVSGTYDVGNSSHFVLRNDGGWARDLVLKYQSNGGYNLQPTVSVPPTHTVELWINGVTSLPQTLTIEYTDEFGERRELALEMTAGNQIRQRR